MSGQGDSGAGMAMRPGQLLCACPADRAASAESGASLAFGFGLALLAQALVLTVLPEQSRLLAPVAARIGWPFALMLAGGAVASFPATLLIDSFGRRAAFALGASFGVAGGAVGAFAVAHNHFGLLCLGAFWLGIAQGFALFYRHVAAQGARGSFGVFAGGAGAALASPLVVEATITPQAALLGSAALHVGALALALRMPHLLADAPAPATRPAGREFFVATGAGALAWFIMAASMLHGPLTLAGCSAAPAFIGGAMGWHLFAMFAPALLAARWPNMFPPAALGVGGAVMLTGAGAVYLAAAPWTAAMGLVLIGVGWSVVNIGVLRLLHEPAPPGRAHLALHDACLFLAAIAGAIAL